MTEAAALDADQNFATLRLRRVDDGFTQWRIEFDERLATHQRHGVCSLREGLYHSSMISCSSMISSEKPVLTHRVVARGHAFSGSCSGFCGPYIGQFLRHGNKAGDRNGLGAPAPPAPAPRGAGRP